jgi:hypothetical protein
VRLKSKNYILLWINTNKIIEDDLDISKALPAKEKAREITKLKAAAKEHLEKR